MDFGIELSRNSMLSSTLSPDAGNFPRAQVLRGFFYMHLGGRKSQRERKRFVFDVVVKRI